MHSGLDCGDHRFAGGGRLFALAERGGVARPPTQVNAMRGRGLRGGGQGLRGGTRPDIRPNSEDLALTLKGYYGFIR